VLPRHEFTASAVVSVTALIVRSAHAHDHDYRIALSLREVYLQSSWTVFGQRALGLRLAAGVALGKPVLDFTRPFDFSIDVFGTEPQPDRVPAPVVSMDASAGFLARIGPVRFGPQLVYSSTWLRDAGGYTVDVDLPFTLSTRLHAVGVGFLVDVRPHPNVSLTVEGRAYLQSRLPGGSIRFGLGFSWSAA
jgi:hypothetical protein